MKKLIGKVRGFWNPFEYYIWYDFYKDEEWLRWMLTISFSLLKFMICYRSIPCELAKWYKDSKTRFWTRLRIWKYIIFDYNKDRIWASVYFDNGKYKWEGFFSKIVIFKDFTKLRNF